MTKIIAGINLTIDGFCDHTAGIPDPEIHKHYEDLLNASGLVLYGRKTYELMGFWKELIRKPSGEKEMDDFAKAMDKIPKLVFSDTLKGPDWHSAKLADKSLEQTVLDLKKEKGRDVLVGSRSLIIQLLNLDLIDEYQFCVHPVVIGSGLPMFDKVQERTIFKLKSTKLFKGGAILLNYTRE